MNRGTSTGKPTKAEAARIKKAEFDWSRVDRSEPSGCWNWMGGVNTWGYGDCKWNGKCTNASRAAFESVNGPIPAGMVVCHRCDNPRCCNPSHLWADTQANNLADCRHKGRARGTFKDGAGHPRHVAKLTAEMVMEARRLYASGVTQTAIGKQMGVHSSVISRAVRGESWGNV